MEFENIKLAITDQVATITLNKPERLNACSLGMISRQKMTALCPAVRAAMPRSTSIIIR